MQTITNDNIQQISNREQPDKPDTPADTKLPGAFFAMLTRNMDGAGSGDKGKQQAKPVQQGEESAEELPRRLTSKEGNGHVKKMPQSEIEPERLRGAPENNQEREIDSKEAKARLASRFNLRVEEVDIKVKPIRPELQEKLPELSSQDDPKAKPTKPLGVENADAEETVSKQPIKGKNERSFVNEAGKQRGAVNQTFETILKPGAEQFDGQPFDTTTGFNEMPEQQFMKQETVGRMALNRPQFSELLERVSDIMARQASAGRRLEVQLEIDRIGKLMVGADRLKDEIHLRILVENSEAKKWLEPHLRTLQQHLREEGIDIDQLDITLEQETEKRTQDQRDHPTAEDLQHNSERNTKTGRTLKKETVQLVYAQRYFGYNTVEILA